MKSIACGWAEANIRGSTIRVLAAALSFAVMLKWSALGASAINLRIVP
jgi:hypothetical protein